MNDPRVVEASCSVPRMDYSQVLLAHGGGGRLMHDLIAAVFQPALADLGLDTTHDGATLHLPPNTERLAFTTDSFVVQPVEFPGGDIGALAVNGTVNDLAMCGATPWVMSLGVVIEEGFELAALTRIAQSIARAAHQARVRIVTGDTKVIERGSVNGGKNLILNTSGIGIVRSGVQLGPAAIRPGDVVVLNGDVGRHGMAIMAAREHIAFESPIHSDCAPLNAEVTRLFDAGLDVHALRDCTRGGVATAVIELATAANLTIELCEAAIRVQPAVKAACELLGFDPLYVANEGRFVAILPPDQAERALALLGNGASVIGKVTLRDSASPAVVLRTPFNTQRVLDLLSGEQLPRIC